mgnify:CR=1 FL=1
MSSIKIGKLEISNNAPLVFIAGPCAIESKAHSLSMAHNLKKISTELGVGLIFKSSFDKANRTSIKSFRGPGIDDGLKVLQKIKDETELPLITDIHEVSQAEVVAEVIDIIQIPAFLCRQTDLLIAAAKTGKIINVKKGQFLAPWDMANVIKKIEDSGNRNILLTERGASFGYNTLVSDMRALPIMSKFGFPIVFDATHSVQQPGGMGEKSGGQREFVPYLARAAIAVGVSALFMETHEDPDSAPSDGPNMIPLNEVKSLLKKLIEIDNLVK